VGYTWDDFPLLQGNPEGTHLELADNGYQLMLAWVAGPRRVVRTLDEREHTTESRIYTGMDVRNPPSKPTRVVVEPRSDEDWAIIDEAANSYLADAGVPPRPRGFRWYLRLSEGVTEEDVWRAVALPREHLSTVDVLEDKRAMAEGIGRLLPL
jgi:hypothetical protein